MNEDGRPQRYGRSVSLAGALIVFLTFVVKDGLRERLKDSKDSLDNVTLAELIQKNHLDELAMTRSVNVNVDSLKNFFAAAYFEHRSTEATHTAEYSDLIEEVTKENDGLVYVHLDLERAEQLSRKLDSGGRFNSEIDNAQKEWTILTSNEKDIQKYLDSVIPDDPLTTKVNKKIRHEFDNQMITAELTSYRSSALAQRVEQLSREMASAAETSSERLETQYQRYTMASYCLYALGWSLALFGRLFGIEDAGAADL
jgi:hypothetical protein